ncbi:hydantoinase/carbamoylase family amidase [Aerococcus christensenii]|uniref:hydantoinase/carbamoylase family amidase n=1 Tax=Aerococcus christensenii TaxID=87541 RepID=UPI0023A9C6E5|nr:hydantoinase/carbamoylase family amidase [Aerococcus christensenii]WEB71565.1 hydantoinase/carbamoylase family amidase [Aerococcus christensenii]
MSSISAGAIDEMLNWLASFTEKPEEKGVTRPLYTQSWQQALLGLKQRFEAIGMVVEFDAVGNLIATVEGETYPDEVIACGSHIDTVTRGGKFDGQLGIVAAYLSVKECLEVYGRPQKSLRIICLAEEEGSRFPYVFWGSKNFFGLAKKEEVATLRDTEGISFEKAMRDCGFDYLIGQPQFCNLAAWFELHIEQGPLLDSHHEDLGIVTSIAGQHRWDIHLKGVQNHAGTTMMSYRHDAVDCMAHIISKQLDKAKTAGDPLVLTFGRISVIPNQVNIVPGQVTFSMNCRHTDASYLNQFLQELEEEIYATADHYGIEASIDKWMSDDPTPLHPEIIHLLEAQATKQGYAYRLMSSGAGQDTQIFAPFVKSGMIFVPSKDGISHAPEEYTAPKEAVHGVRLLSESLRDLAYS